MAIVNSTIASSGADYPSTAAWEAAIPADTTDQHIATITEDYVVDTLVFWNVSNASNMRHRVTVDPSVRHTFVDGTGARIVRAGLGLQISTNGFDIQGLMFSGGSGVLSFNNSGGSHLLEECFFVNNTDQAGPPLNQGGLWTNGGDVELRGCGGVNASNVNGEVFKMITTSGSKVTMTNCSALQSDSGYTPASPMGVFFCSGAGTIEFNNCKSFGASLDSNLLAYRISGTTVANSAENVAGDTTNPGTGGASSEAAADHYEVVTAGSEDLHIKSTLDKSNFIGGDQLAGTFDAEGDERFAGACDIGCDQESTAPSGGGVVARARGWLRTGLRLGSR